MALYDGMSNITTSVVSDIQYHPPAAQAATSIEEPNHIIQTAALESLIKEWRERTVDPESDSEETGETMKIIQHTERKVYELVANQLETIILLMQKDKNLLDRERDVERQKRFEAELEYLRLMLEQERLMTKAKSQQMLEQERLMTRAKSQQTSGTIPNQSIRTTSNTSNIQDPKHPSTWEKWARYFK